MNRSQPVCTGTNEKGELTWKPASMEFWQIVQLYYKHYCGDFGEQWMWLVLQEKGMEWSE